MKKIIVSTFLFFWIPYVFGQLLWKIEGNGIKQDSYLFGTIHLIPKTKFKVSDKVIKAFKEMDVLALEIDLNLTLSEKITAAKEMILPQNSKLSDYMDEKDFSKLKSFCLDSIGLSASKFKRYLRLKPFYFSSILIKESIGKSEGYDLYFNKQANKQKKKVMGLEKLEDQLNLVNKIDMQEQINLLKESSSAELNEYYLMLEAYLKEDLHALNKIINNSSSMTEVMQNDFLNKRNENWIPVIEKTIREHKTFIAVGAAHLLGENGLIELLIEKGYKLSPVTR